QDDRGIWRDLPHAVLERHRHFDAAVPVPGRRRQRHLHLLPAGLAQRLRHRLGPSDREAARHPHPALQSGRADAAPEGAVTRAMSLEIVQIPCLSDNYGYLVHDEATGITASIDTPDAEAILRALAE